MSLDEGFSQDRERKGGGGNHRPMRKVNDVDCKLYYSNRIGYWPNIAKNITRATRRMLFEGFSQAK